MKFFSLSLVLVLLLLGAGCQSLNIQDDIVPQKNQLDQDAYDPAQFPPDFVVFHDQESVGQTIVKNLKSNKKIKEINRPTNITIPSGITKEQFAKFFELGTDKFALVQQASMNTGFFNDPKPYSGIWYAAVGDQEWKPFLEIKNDRSYTENNPFYLWNEGAKIKLLISDNRGAGSGEGIAKIIISENGGKNWKTERCFYFVPDKYFEQQRTLGLNFLPWLKKNLRMDYNKGGIVGDGEEYEYNIKTGNYESYQLIDKTSKGVVVNNDCKNIVLP
jgi:hypothetical protein